MNRRNFFKSLAVLPWATGYTFTNNEHVEKEVVVKVPICIDFLMETCKEREIPGYVPKEVAWADLDLETGEWTVCEDEDPIYQHKVLNEWWS